MKKIIYLLTAICILTFGCNNLDEGIYNQLPADQFYATEQGINAALANIYDEIRGDFGGKGVAGADRGWFDLNETCTDELMLPTRADGAWADNGIWRQMYQHEWTPAHEFMNNAWLWLYRAVFKANLSIDLLEKANANAAAIAEAKVLRAYFYYMLMDAFGKVQFFTKNDKELTQVPQVTRQEIYNFVVSELVANVDQLPTTKRGTFYGRFNKWAGYTLLAKVYLNAQVYTGTAKFAEASAACDKVINEGGFTLTAGSNYFDMFQDKDVLNNNEIILAIYIDSKSSPRNIIGIRSLGGAQGQALFGFSTWNGGCVHENFVNKYETGDTRKAQWIVGAQTGGITYQASISSLTAAGANDGQRNTKFLPVAPFQPGSSASNDFPIYRYADVLLMKAEALLRTSNASGAKTLIDQIRNRAGLANLASNPTLDDIYDERGRELCWEGHRRQDMIRFDKFLLPHDFKTSTSDTKYKVFPIPAPVLANNTSLVQNPGY